MNFIRVLKARSRVPSVILESLDPSSALSAGILNALALALFFACVMGLTVVVPFFAVRKGIGYALVSVLMAACVISWYGLHSLAHDSVTTPARLAGRVRGCGWILVSTVWSVAAALVLLNGGIRSRALTVFVGAIVASGGILGKKVAVLAAVVFLAFTFVLAILELSGIHLPYYLPAPPVTTWYILIFVAILATFPLVELFSSISDLLARLHTILETAPDAIFILNLDGRIVDVNQSALRQLGYTKRELVGVHVTEFVAPEFHARVRSRFPEISGPTFYESCHLRRDGTEIPVELNTCRIVFHGQPAMLAIARDLTARRRIHERLQALNGQLLTAQEEERRRIARDLHDDITQRIAGLSMELGMLRRQGNPDLAGRLELLYRQTIQMAEDLRNIARDIHPSLLEHAGLPAALEAFCRQASLQRKISIDCTVDGLPHGIPDAVSITLYRVTQEAVGNAVKHADASAINVTLKAIPDEQGKMALNLTVSDNGKGFLPEEVQRGSSLGLLSMEERVHLVKGSFTIHSQPGAGSHLDVMIPLPALATSATV